MKLCDRDKNNQQNTEDPIVMLFIRALDTLIFILVVGIMASIALTIFSITTHETRNGCTKDESTRNEATQ